MQNNSTYHIHLVTALWMHPACPVWLHISQGCHVHHWTLAGVWKETEYYDPNVFIKWSEILQVQCLYDITYSVLGLFV